MLSRHQTDPGCQLAAIGKRLDISNAGHERACGESANPGDFGQALTAIIALMPAFYLRLEFFSLAAQIAAGTPIRIPNLRSARFSMRVASPRLRPGSAG